MNLEQVMTLTRTISGATAFNERECAAYWALAEFLPPESTIVEIGLQFGRSSSIVAQVAKEKGHRYIGIDPFIQPPEAGPEWKALMATIGVAYTLYEMTTAELPPLWHTGLIDLALIDGCHDASEVRIDCQHIFPLMASGGHVCFHDYGPDSLPEVYPTVQEEMGKAGPEWKEVGTYGTLGIWRYDRGIEKPV